MLKKAAARRLLFFRLFSPGSAPVITARPCIFAAVNQPTPAIVTQSAVRRLPRLALILFCAAYVLPGFLGREPWKNADVSAFGVMLEMAIGHSGWS